MANLLNKFKYGVVSVQSSEDDEQLLTALLKWFNNNPCFYYRQVIQLVREFAKSKISAIILIDIGAIGFFQTLRLYAPEDIHSDVDLIVEVLKQVRNEKDHTVTFSIEPSISDQPCTDLHTSRFQKYATKETIISTFEAPKPKNLIKKIDLAELDKQYLFEINVKLQQRRVDLIQEALSDLKKAPLLEFPIEYFVQSSEIIRSLLSLLLNDFGMVIDLQVLECLGALFEKLSFKILDSSLENYLIIDNDSMLYIFKYCYSKFVNIFKMKPSLLGRLVDILKLILDGFLEKICSSDKLTLMDSLVNIYDDIENLLHEKMDILDTFKIIDLLTTILNFSSSNVLQDNIEKLSPTLQKFLLDNFLYLCFPTIHSQVVSQMKRFENKNSIDYSIISEIEKSFLQLDQLMDEECDTLPDAEAHLNRLCSILPSLPHLFDKNILERYLQELFITSEFLNNSCLEVLISLLSFNNKDIRSYVMKFIAEDQQVFMEKFACEDIFYLISLHSMEYEGSVKTILDIVQNSPCSIRGFLPHIPLLQCTVKYSENILSSKKDSSDEVYSTLQLFERLMTKEELLAYHTRFLFHKYKWIRETACVNLKSLIILDFKAEKNIDPLETDPFLSSYLEDVDKYFDSSTANDTFDSDIESLLSLLADTQDSIILKSVANQLSSLFSIQPFHNKILSNEVIELVLKRLYENISKELIVLLILILDNKDLTIEASKFSKLYTMLFHNDLEIRKLSFMLISRIVFSKERYLLNGTRFKTRLVFETNKKEYPIPKIISESFYIFPNCSLYRIESDSETKVFPPELMNFFIFNRSFIKNSEEPQFEVLNELYPKFFIKNSLLKLSQARSHGEFLTNLQILQDFLMMDRHCFNQFFDSDWRRVFLKFLQKQPTSKADDIVLENLIGFFSQIAKKKRLEKDIISELSFCFCKNFVNILQPSQTETVVHDRTNLRTCMLKFLDFCVQSLQEDDSVDELKLLLNDDSLLITIRGYIKKKIPYDLRVDSLRCICRIGMSDKIFIPEIIEILKAIFEEIIQLLLQEIEALEAGIFYGSHCVYICLMSLESLSGLFRKYNISWIDFVKENERILSLVFSKNVCVRESALSIISNGLHTKEMFDIIEKSNPKLLDLLMSKLVSSENESVKDQCIWILSKSISLSVSHLDYFLEYIPFQQVFKLGDRNLESVTSLIYQLLLKDPSSQSKILFENSSLNFILQRLEDISTLSVIPINSLENLLKIVKIIIENNNDISSYLLKDTTLLDNIQKIVSSLLTYKRVDKLIELSFCIMNNLVSFSKNDNLSLEYLKSRENTLRIISAALQSSLSMSVNLVVAKYLTTLIGRKCLPYNSAIGEHVFMMEIVEELQRLYFSIQDSFFVDNECEECIVLGKSLSWLLTVYTNTNGKVQEIIIERINKFNRKIISSLSIDFMHTSRSDKSNNVEQLKRQLVLNFSILQQLFQSKYAKDLSIEINLFQDLKYIWFSDFIDSEIRLSILYVCLNMSINCERTKLEFALDVNKNRNNSLLFDIVSGSLSTKSKLTNSNAYFMLLSSLISTGEVRYAMSKYGLIDKIISGLKEIFIRKKDDTRMEYCVKLLSHLSFFDDCHESFLQSDTIDILFEQLEKSPNERVKDCIILIFRNLLFCKSMSTLILRVEELCVLVLKTSALMKENPSITNNSSNLIWTYLSLYIDAKRVLKRGPIIEMLKNTFSHPSCPEITLQVFKKICHVLDVNV